MVDYYIDDRNSVLILDKQSKVNKDGSIDILSGILKCKCCGSNIIKRTSKAHIIYENHQLISFLDIDPINENHVLIIPKQHVDTREELSDETLSNIVSSAKKIVTALKEIYGNNASI